MVKLNFQQPLLYASFRSCIIIIIIVIIITHWPQTVKQ